MRTAYGVAGLLLTLSVALAEEAPDWIKSPDPSKYLLTAAELPQLPAVAGEITVYPVGFGRLRDKKGDYWGPRLHRGLLSQTFTNPDQPERQATVQVRVHETPFYALFTWRYEMRSQHEDRQTALDDLYQNGGAGKPNPSGVWQHVGNLIIGISGNWQPFEDAYRDALLRKHASAHSVPQRRAPCAESRFFYTAEQLEGYYTDQPSLLYEPDQIVSDLRGALQRYARDGGRLQAGVGLRDAVRISLAFQTGALPTGHEAALHEAGRALAATRPGGRIDAGDLLYLSLKLHQGDVRSALLCCHAALYRGDTTNAPFINTTLRPIRNAAGYSDQKVAAKGRGGTELNARQTVGSDHQGPYYHIFGLAALQLADDHGLTPFWAMRMGAEWFNSRAGELRQDFPTSAFGGRLTNYAVALENEMRRGSAVDPDKHCLNYAGIRAGVELGKELGQLRQPARFIPPPPSEGDILQPDTTVIYRSPLSLEIRGVRGETFAFDQRTKQFSGNTPQVIIEPLPEADGTWGLAVTPLFPVQSLQLRGAGTGPAEVGVYSYRARVAQVFPLQVRDGEALEVTDWRGTPVLRQNGAPVIAFGAPPPAATVPPTAGKVGQLVVCRTVEGGQPQGAADRFAQAARLTCFWRYRDRPTTTVTCVWSRAGKEILRSEREVGGSGSVWFSIATRAAAGLASGDWTVALLAGNEVLARRRFQIGEE